MSLLQVIFFSIIQGITEFLPVSSSAHLAMIQRFMDLKPPILFYILIHVGTLLSVILFLKNDLLKIIRFALRRNYAVVRIIVAILIGTLPAVIAGLFLKDRIEEIFNSPGIIGIASLVNAFILFSLVKVEERENKDDLEKIKWPEAVLIGIFQALAILPGISRSGSTISAGLWKGLSRRAAFKFSFLLAIPAILGSVVLEFKQTVLFSPEELFLSLIGLMVSAVAGYLALFSFEKVLKSSKMYLFGFYSLFLGLIFLIV